MDEDHVDRQDRGMAKRGMAKRGMAKRGELVQRRAEKVR